MIDAYEVGNEIASSAYERAGFDLMLRDIAAAQELIALVDEGGFDIQMPGLSSKGGEGTSGMQRRARAGVAVDQASPVEAPVAYSAARVANGVLPELDGSEPIRPSSSETLRLPSIVPAPVSVVGDSNVNAFQGSGSIHQDATVPSRPPQAFPAFDGGPEVGAGPERPRDSRRDRPQREVRHSVTLKTPASAATIGEASDFAVAPVLTRGSQEAVHGRSSEVFADIGVLPRPAVSADVRTDASSNVEGEGLRSGKGIDIPDFGLPASVGMGDTRGPAGQASGRSRSGWQMNASDESPAGMLTERSVAPERSGSVRSGPKRGVLKLDGQLVGQWLSDQMARAASRPGSGPTFFDSRQGPAWTPSGVP